MASNPRFADKVSYKLSYRVRIMAASGVKEVTCPSHDAAASIELNASPPMVSLSEEGELVVRLLQGLAIASAGGGSEGLASAVQ